MNAIELRDLMFNLIPGDGTLIGNVTLRKQFLKALGGTDSQPESRSQAERMYWQVREDLLNLGLVKKGKGKGGSVKRAHVMQSAPIIPEGMGYAETTVLAGD